MSAVIPLLQQAIHTYRTQHPDDAFPLLHHRKQTIMTVRTLLLENALMSFMAMLLGFLKTKVSLNCLLHLLFERSGARIETSSQVVYWVNTEGLSVPYRHLLTKVIEGLCAMGLKDQGKPIEVRLKDMSP